MDAVKQRFNDLISGGEQAIDRMVSERTAESLVLDFKCLERDAAPLDLGGRKTLAEVISGFANSGGGVIVWGVYAHRPSPEEPDEAQTVKPISQLRRLRSDLNEFTPQCVSPPVVGVEHEIIIKAGENDIGYAVSYIPKSHMLHMAIAKKSEQYCYFIRSGASFIRMESFMVADRLSRRPAPQIGIDVRVDIVDGFPPGVKQYALTIGIENTGIGIATYPALRVQPASRDLGFDELGIDGNRNSGLPRQLGANQNNARYYTGGINNVVHSGTIMEVTRLLRPVLRDWEGPESTIEFLYDVYCDGDTQMGRMVIPIGQLIVSDLHFKG